MPLMRRTSMVRVSAVVLGGALLVAGGAGAPVAAADPPVTLRLATASGDEGRLADMIRGFAQDVTAASDGSIVIEPVWSAQGTLKDGGDEQVLVGRVTSGELELVLGGSRGFDDSGSTVLQALQTPFLIDHDAIASAVATSEVATSMLDGLADAGLVGLAMWPTGLRHPITFETHPEPFLVPADLDGMHIRSSTSAMAWALLEAYGAIPSQINDFQVSDYEGEEQGLAGRGEPGRTATGDVTFGARYDVLAMDDAAFSRLTPGQQEVLRTAAIALRDGAIAAVMPEATAAARFCEDGGRVVLAGPDALAAFVAGAAPLTAALESGEATRDAVAAIRALKDETAAAPGAAACEPGAQPTPAASAAAWVPSVAPDGVYRAEMTRAEVGDSAGTWTWTISGGETTLTWSGRPGQTCHPTTTLTDDAWQLTFADGTFCLEEVADLHWQEADDGIAVTLAGITPPSLYRGEAPWYDRVWRRIE